MVNRSISEESTVHFKDRPYTNMHNRDSSVGLSVIRPTYNPIHLKKIDKDSVTVIAPFLKECEEHDEPQNMANEYVLMKEQKIILRE